MEEMTAAAHLGVLVQLQRRRSPGLFAIRSFDRYKGADSAGRIPFHFVLQLPDDVVPALFGPLFRTQLLFPLCQILFNQREDVFAPLLRFGESEQFDGAICKVVSPSPERFDLVRRQTRLSIEAGDKVKVAQDAAVWQRVDQGCWVGMGRRDLYGGADFRG